MTLVIDAALAVAWCIDSETTPATEALLDRTVEEGAAVPALWRLEVANALQIAVRRRRLAATRRDEALTQLGLMRITTDPETDAHAWAATLRLADRFALTAYDAAYLELAHRRTLPLATLDAALRQAAASLGLPTP